MALSQTVITPPTHFPALQSERATAPDVAVYVPPEQLMQAACPPALWKVPAPQLTHPVLPELALE